MTIKKSNFHNSQEVKQILFVIHESILSCVKDHHNDEFYINEWLSNKTTDNLKKWMKHNYSLVYLDENNKIIGFFMSSLDLSKKEGTILLNYVLPLSQNKGIGSQLLETAEIELRSMGIKQLSAESTITAKEFYQARCFKITKKIQENDQLVAYEMMKEIK